ncbi:YdcF family protein [Longimycelium tulufanense]|nr:YdcF family protein [Longimycelium tulufanense]
MLRLLRRTVFGAVLVASLVVGGTAFRVWQVARADDLTRADMVVVLGAAQYNGRPSGALTARLERARDLYRQGVGAKIVTVGGKLPGDNYTEAETGRRWLADQGIPVKDLVAVDEGGDTLGSMKAVAELARERGWRSAVIVSDPWHSLRARTMARDVGLDAWAAPTRHGPMVQTRETQGRYIIRETGALLYYRLTHAPAGESVSL